MSDTPVVVCETSVGPEFVRPLRSAGYHVHVAHSICGWLDQSPPLSPFCVIVEADDHAFFEDDCWHRLRDLGAGIVVHGGNDMRFVVRAMREGAADVLAKPVDVAMLLTAVALALERTASTRNDVERGERARALLAQCTARELEVMARVTSGVRNKVIAADLDCSEATVKVHRSRAMRKLGLRSVTDLLRLVEAAGGRAALEHVAPSPAQRGSRWPAPAAMDALSPAGQCD